MVNGGKGVVVVVQGCGGHVVARDLRCCEGSRCKTGARTRDSCLATGLETTMGVDGAAAAALLAVPMVNASQSSAAPATPVTKVLKREVSCS